ncbi:MAG TPA: hypothetical protein DCE48_10040 [Lachnospiraceae bacterium]|nr:hypothetical protein [Lachnospiraceae bacterium]
MLYNVYDLEGNLIGADLKAKEVYMITGIRSNNVAMYADKKMTRGGKYRVEFSVPTLEQLDIWEGDIRKAVNLIKNNSFSIQNVNINGRVCRRTMKC